MTTPAINDETQPAARGTFAAYSTHIAVGDTVIAYSSPKNITFLTVKKDGVFANTHGSFPHNSMILKPWGSKLPSHSGKGFIYLLFPTPELWTLSLPHRTQILYHPDISFVTTMLDLKPGVKMIEAGTGSGSFSHAIARTIAPGGQLYTFEFSKDRYEKAKVEFANHGLESVVGIQHRDVCKDGFDMENEVDAVFLDLPAPWDALVAAKKAFKRRKAGRICCFSPCMEQVLKTCTALKELGFVDIQMHEVLIRPYDVRSITSRPLPKYGDKPLKTKNGDSKKRKAPETAVKTEPTDTPAVDQNNATTSSTSQDIIVTKPQSEVRGHTSYLTFATLLPQEWGSA